MLYSGASFDMMRPASPAEAGQYQYYPVVGFPSGQREQTVNLPSSTSKVRILPPPPSLFHPLIIKPNTDSILFCPVALRLPGLRYFSTIYHPAQRKQKTPPERGFNGAECVLSDARAQPDIYGLNTLPARSRCVPGARMGTGRTASCPAPDAHGK